MHHWPGGIVSIALPTETVWYFFPGLCHGRRRIPSSIIPTIPDANMLKEGTGFTTKYIYDVEAFNCYFAYVQIHFYVIDYKIIIIKKN